MKALILIALLAGPKWTQQEPTTILNTSQKVSLGSTVAAIWTGISAPNVVDLHCVSDPDVRCRPIELRAGTIVDFDNAEIALDIKDADGVTPRSLGAFVMFVGESGGVVTWEWSPGYKTLVSAEQTALGSWIALVWSTVPIKSVVVLKAHREPGGVIEASIRRIKSGTRAEYLAVLKAGKHRARNGSE